MKFPISVMLYGVLAVPMAYAETLSIAVASNFADTAEALADDFESETEHELRLVRGSTGKLYAQIVNGAPIDVFLSADSERPIRLANEQRAVASSRFTYAIGQLVVWSRDPALVGQDCIDVLQHTDEKKIAIANPALAPYGRAAKEFLVSRGLWQRVRPDLVFGENIAQAFQFVASGNAHIGIVARAQLLHSSTPESSCEFAVPGSEHTLIEQQAVILTRAAEHEAARDFMRYLRSRPAGAIIMKRGYRVPEGSK